MKKPKPLGMCSAIPTSDIVRVVREVIETEPTDDMSWIRWWLSAIGETDQKCREEVRDQCKADAEAKSFYVECARNLWKENLHSTIISL